jgi:hypothetical protein
MPRPRPDTATVGLSLPGTGARCMGTIREEFQITRVVTQDKQIQGETPEQQGHTEDARGRPPGPSALRPRAPSTPLE